MDRWSDGPMEPVNEVKLLARRTESEVTPSGVTRSLVVVGRVTWKRENIQADERKKETNANTVYITGDAIFQPSAMNERTC